MRDTYISVDPDIRKGKPVLKSDIVHLLGA